MSRLIDADALLKKMRFEVCTDCLGGIKGCGNCYYDRAMDAINDAPTVDAVEVVRCCECRHCEVVNNDTTFAICKAPPKTLFLSFDIDIRTHFCSYGEMEVSE